MDQKYTENAIRELELFMLDYPYSKYNDEAKKYILELKTKLANKLLKSAYIYRKVGAHDSALMYIDRLLERYYDTEVVKEALKNLDTFNLEVAKFRVEHGMSPDLRQLYVGMGKLNTKLTELEIDALGIEGLDETICSTFRAMRLREGEADA